MIAIKGRDNGASSKRVCISYLIIIMRQNHVANGSFNFKGLKKGIFVWKSAISSRMGLST
jgi:hypothetical protein